MKLETTKKAVMATFPTVIQINYCAAQCLLAELTPKAFTTRREGWAADIYQIGHIAISTGVAPFGDVKPSFSLVRKFENRALDIALFKKFETPEKKREAHDALLREFLAAVFEEHKTKENKKNEKKN